MIDDTELDTNGKPVVYYCLGALKGVSPDQVDAWLALKPFKDMDDAVIKAVVSGCSSKNLSVLAAVGGFERIAPNTPYVISSLPGRLEEVKKAVNRLKSKAKRQQAKALKLQAANTLDLSLGLAPIDPEPDWTEVAQYGFDMGDGFELLATPLGGAKFDRIKQEMQYIGYAVSGTLLDEYEVGVRRKADMTPTWWVSHTTEGSRTKVAGVITKIVPKTDRNNRRMAFVTISDGRSDIRVVIFASLFGQFQGATWRENKAVVVDGRRDKDGLVAEDITFLRKDSDAKQTQYQEDTGPNF
jgi:DNA polymerase III alpha subunit